MNRKHNKLPPPGTYKQPHPITGKLVSRQRVHQIKNYEKGLCISCGKERDSEKKQCDECAKKKNKTQMRHTERRERARNANWLKTNKEIAFDIKITESYVSKLRGEFNKDRDKVIEDTLMWVLYCADVKAYTNFCRWFSSSYAKVIDFLVGRNRVVIVEDNRSEGICLIPIDEKGEYMQWCQLTFSN